MHHAATLLRSYHRQLAQTGDAPFPRKREEMLRQRHRGAQAERRESSGADLVAILLRSCSTCGQQIYRLYIKHGHTDAEHNKTEMPTTRREWGGTAASPCSRNTETPHNVRFTLSLSIRNIPSITARKPSFCHIRSRAQRGDSVALRLTHHNRATLSAHSAKHNTELSHVKSDSTRYLNDPAGV